MRQPDNILYWKEDKPPRQIALILALQQMSFLGVYLVVSPWFGRILQLDHEQSFQLISATLLGSGIGVALQANNRWGVGSGYFIPLQVTSATFAALTLAKTIGGPGAMFGMVGLVGLAQMAFAHLFVRMRAVFNVEVAGVAVLLIGLGLGYNGIKLVLEVDTAQISVAQSAWVCLLTLGTMVLCNVWFTGYVRLFSAFLGLCVGFFASWAMDIIPANHWRLLHEVPLFYLPRPMNLGWNFDLGIVLPSLITGLFLALHGFGAVVAAQRFNDADWKRPDLAQVERGIRAEGVTNLICSLLNGLPVTSSGGAVSLAAATGCTSRYPAYWLSGVMIVLAFLPKFIALWDILPQPAAGSAMIFLAAFTSLAGLQMIASRLLDNRKILAVGISLILGVSYEPLKALLENAPPSLLKTMLFSGVALGVTAAVLLSALFRFRDHTRQRLKLDAQRSSMDEVVVFLEQQGKRWGARAEVVRRAEYATWQAFEVLVEHGLVYSVDDETSWIELETIFNEFTFSVVLHYTGSTVSLATHPPSHEELLESEDAVMQMAGYLLYRLADQVRTRIHEQRCELRLVFND